MPRNLSAKILTLEELTRQREELAAAGKKLVLTNGCFDLLHVGHVRYLAQARALGDAMAVAINGDESVRQLKGPDRPYNTAQDRAEVIAALESVDFVTVFHSVRLDTLIRDLRPMVYAKGGDYTLDSLDQGEPIPCSKLPQPPDPILMPRKLRLAILGSGKGSNCQAILEAIASGNLDAEAVIVLTDNPQAGILRLAAKHGIPTGTIETGKFRTRLEEDTERQLASDLQALQIDLVVLAGYMRMVKAPLLDAFPRKIINIHPSLLPAYPGLRAWQQALEAGEDKAGCTVHYVDAGMDTGEIIDHAEVPILDGDTAESLHARIQVAEHRLYPQVIKKLASAHTS